ncbi:type I-E CRISPR-associated endoribonuclease Cas2e [Sphingomonas rubra]|uniref:type I-E CRISPR-associated endoribonuclease Cas2e n=1 Tax=Sphingomonas rubra TaxID=634430 RepID=UPI003CCBCC29
MPIVATPAARCSATGRSRSGCGSAPMPAPIAWGARATRRKAPPSNASAPIPTVATPAQPRMSAGVRGRIWTVVEEWHGRLRRGSIVMCWAEPASAGGLGLSVLGEPPKDVIAHESVLLVRRALPARHSPEQRG